MNYKKNMVTTNPIHNFLSYIKTKQVMSWRLKPTDLEESQSGWVHISDKEIERDFLRYAEGYNRADTIEQLEQEGAIVKKKVEVAGARPYNVYKLLPAYWDYIEFNIELMPAVVPTNPMHKTMVGHLAKIMIDINSYADVLTPDYLQYFQQFMQHRQSEYINRFVTVCEFAGRFHSPVTNLNRSVRPNITIEYEPTTGLDVMQMQPMILGKVLDQFVPGNPFTDAIYSGQDVYIYLQQKAGLETRDKGKKLFFELAFGYPNDKLQDYFGNEPFIDWINKVKRTDNPKNPHRAKRHSNMAWLLQTSEVKIMEQVWSSHIAAGIPFLTVHDEIIVKQSDQVQSEKLFRNILDKEFKSYQLNTKS